MGKRLNCPTALHCKFQLMRCKGHVVEEEQIEKHELDWPSYTRLQFNETEFLSGTIKSWRQITLYQWNFLSKLEYRRWFPALPPSQDRAKGYLVKIPKAERCPCGVGSSDGARLSLSGPIPPLRASAQHFSRRLPRSLVPTLSNAFFRLSLPGIAVMFITLGVFTSLFICFCQCLTQM